MNLVIAPVYNEADALEKVLINIRRHHKGAILVVDDGSTDGSSDILARIDWVKTLTHTRNSGYGRSLIDGFNYAIENGYDQAVTIDCDEQHEPALIPEMFRAHTAYDVLSGSRYLVDSDSDDAPPVGRRGINRTITQLLNGITEYELTDSFCGFKRYSVKALSKLSLDEPGYAMPLQFWIQAMRFGLTVAEIPAPRIYKNLDRSFGTLLDNPKARLTYYRQVIEKELKRWSISILPEMTQTAFCGSGSGRCLS